jgi:NAD(P)-dependent dehydrogenase (short-subunit alcohol dehydrogenase family)
LDGRIAVVTGAGRGLGREHALHLAEHGARVVVNDLGADARGGGSDGGPADEVAHEIRARGGTAVANADDVSNWDGARRLIQLAVEHFGGLDILVNNAGILRDRMLVNMTEDDWDSVLTVVLKGHFCPTRHAFEYWRVQSKAGREVKASVVHTTSISGLLGNPGQTNYGTAKIGIAAFSAICALEGAQHGVRSNAVAPAARTRLSLGTPGASETLAVPSDGTFDVWDPANVSPLIGYLATRDCPFTGETFYAFGDVVGRFQPFVVEERIVNDGRRWTIQALATRAAELEPGGQRRGGLGELDAAGRPRPRS